eukprot:TRINITY_DN356_c0_g1_i1.p1 TRINITY_DN356_c0_g1~~TRINITY_DN356_c0_g1_i1.p1  ORF type:complete len:742 (+),score=89.23 TRINITY_DN356_c0_g1_i1:174-2399(+)
MCIRDRIKSAKALCRAVKSAFVPCFGMTLQMPSLLVGLMAMLTLTIFPDHLGAVVLCWSCMGIECQKEFAQNAIGLLNSNSDQHTDALGRKRVSRGVDRLLASYTLGYTVALPCFAALYVQCGASAGFGGALVCLVLEVVAWVIVYFLCPKLWSGGRASSKRTATHLDSKTGPPISVDGDGLLWCCVLNVTIVSACISVIWNTYLPYYRYTYNTDLILPNLLHSAGDGIGSLLLFWLAHSSHCWKHRERYTKMPSIERMCQLAAIVFFVIWGGVPVFWVTATVHVLLGVVLVVWITESNKLLMLLSLPADLGKWLTWSVIGSNTLASALAVGAARIYGDSEAASLYFVAIVIALCTGVSTIVMARRVRLMFHYHSDEMYTCCNFHQYRIQVYHDRYGFLPRRPASEQTTEKFGFPEFLLCVYLPFVSMFVCSAPMACVGLHWIVMGWNKTFLGLAVGIAYFFRILVVLGLNRAWIGDLGLNLLFGLSLVLFLPGCLLMDNEWCTLVSVFCCTAFTYAMPWSVRLQARCTDSKRHAYLMNSIMIPSETVGYSSSALLGSLAYEHGGWTAVMWTLFGLLASQLAGSLLDLHLRQPSFPNLQEGAQPANQENPKHSGAPCHDEPACLPSPEITPRNRASYMSLRRASARTDDPDFNDQLSPRGGGSDEEECGLETLPQADPSSAEFQASFRFKREAEYTDEDEEANALQEFEHSESNLVLEVESRTLAVVELSLIHISEPTRPY